MRFYFVDQITERTLTFIAGAKTFVGWSGPVAPSAIAEGIGQLASWLCLERNDFTARPVFLFADRIEVLDQVAGEETVELTAELSRFDAESVRFSGFAVAHGRVVQRIVDCSGHFMPLADLEDPIVCRARFTALTNGGMHETASGQRPFTSESLLGRTLEVTAGKRIRTVKTFAADEWFYADHFPRNPVTPIVMLNEMIGRATAAMLGCDSQSEIRPHSITDVKIRSFVRPGATVETLVRTTALEGRKLSAAAEVSSEGRVILRGHYHYEIGEDA